ncbi:50S ribosomal protein L3 [Spiroplasma endosymbiont of 'Nebria riversi']|uniref:50S ribosomal protein L3 n=1 Tax=Spiroplasma endosymbiont of 'Nebria riversi' TaxID=2792084 RepID=UPI001C04CFD3|nr:50S ribosomal protein L3 [Spiroplasma endosymbiont of 'Nebria riversi']
MKGILGRKIAMSQVFTVEGKIIPVTVIEAQPNVVTDVKTAEKNGYTSLQLAVEDKRSNLVNKPLIGHFKRAKTTPKRFSKEIREMSGFNMGDIINCDIFTPGELVDVRAISKGKGFAGVIKRHNYSRGPMAHGSGFHREIGSMGAIAPNRIFKGKKMPGRMGHQQVTMQNLQVIHIDVAKNALLVKGSIPGPKKQFVVITEAIKGLKTKTPPNLVNNQPPVETTTVDVSSVAPAA